MSGREIPSLSELILKSIAKTPIKCMTEKACETFLTALEKKNVFGERDIVQIILSYIIEAGRMTDEAAPPFIFRNRKLINIANSKLSGRYMVKMIPFCKETLICLCINGCFQIDDEKLLYLLDECRSIQALNISNCRKLTNNLLKGMTKYHHLELHSLHIGGNFNINNEGIEYFFTHYPHIHKFQSLSISGLLIEEKTLLMICKKCIQLQEFGLSYQDISEPIIIEMLRTLGSNLTKLILSWPSITPLSRNPQTPAPSLVDAIVSFCPNLTDLDLSGNRQFTLPLVLDLIERKNASVVNGGKPLEFLTMKFIATPRQTMENNLVNAYPNIKFTF